VTPSPNPTKLDAAARLPRPTPVQTWRPPSPKFPPTPAQRSQVLQAVRHYVAEFNPVAPLSLPELKTHAARVVASLQCPSAYSDFISVLINNESWREQLAAVPYHRRLLLLPKCLRVEDQCPASFDDFGLVCKQCGRCPLQELIGGAEKLGYAVLVAEGSAVVMSLLQSGRIDAVIGVSCLSVLEKAFPHMQAAAVPGAAIPLLQGDCHDTNVDLDWVWEYIYLTADDQTRRLDLSHLRQQIEGWFTAPSLENLMGPAEDQTELLAREWLMRAGKRWRPLLTAAVFQATHPHDLELPTDLKRVALAIECFHKASLIHDDIEDGDALRYHQSTLHAEHGIPVALNVGDFLIGEGYRLLANVSSPPEIRAAMTAAAAAGHRELCRGQGAELLWTRNPVPLSPLQVIEIFRRKTAPAFEVALHLGALYTGTHPDCAEVLQSYSRALGIAFQIRDDLEDLHADAPANDIDGRRPSLLLAVAFERALGEDREFLEQLWRRQSPPSAAKVESLCRKLEADLRCRQFLESYKDQALRSLVALENPSLKGLLRRVASRIFDDLHIQGWCREQQQAQRAQPVPAPDPLPPPANPPTA